MASEWWFAAVLVATAAMGQALADGRDAQVANQSAAPQSAAELRAEGPAGLDKLLREYDGLQQELQSIQRESAPRKNIDRSREHVAELRQRTAQLEKAIDEVGAQRGCSVSRLYWYTELNAAKEAATRTGRPILSLRLLGKLTDEYSCANSRFFRTALYSNKEVSDFLRTNFVLHWQSVRPVPRVTIDFGDGRKLERTLTGNSAHYVLASDGTPLDVLPGLYSPLAFRQWLWDAADFYSKYRAAANGDRAGLLQAFHRTQYELLLRHWDLDIQRLGDQRAELVATRINGAIEAARIAGKSAPPAGPAPKAVAAAKRAVGKTQAEAPILRFANLGGTWIERGMDDDVWQAIADLHRSDTKLDLASVQVIRREFPRAAVAARLAISKRAQEDPLLRVVRSFEDSVTLDTVRNEYLLHRRIHEKFLDDPQLTTNMNSLNEWVYAELFLTPSRDPWLGLAPSDVYTALENDGRTEPAAKTSGSGG